MVNIRNRKRQHSNECIQCLEEFKAYRPVDKFCSRVCHDKWHNTSRTTLSRRRQILLSKFGITNEQYEELLKKQNYCCAVCGKHESEFKKKLAVDHEHRDGYSGPVRGLLCFRCNRLVVGNWKRETSGTLLKAYEYLNSEYPGWIVPPKKKRKRRVRRNRSRT